MYFIKRLSKWYGFTELKELQDIADDLNDVAAYPNEVEDREKAKKAKKALINVRMKKCEIAVKIALTGLVAAGVVTGGIFLAPVVAASAAVSLTATLIFGAIAVGTVVLGLAVYKGVKAYKKHKVHNIFISLCDKVIERNKGHNCTKIYDLANDLVRENSALVDNLFMENSDFANRVLDELEQKIDPYNKHLPQSSDILPQNILNSYTNVWLLHCIMGTCNQEPQLPQKTQQPIVKSK